jgi:ABC-type sugar transport system substrate-binding protein
MTDKPTIGTIYRRRALTLAATLVLMFLSGTAVAAEPAFKVGFLAGGDRENNFWVRMGEFAEAVAEDLNIDFRAVYPTPATYVIKKKGERLLAGLGKNDYFITGYFDSVTSDLLDLAEERRIRTFIINTEILDQDQVRMGSPRDKSRHWIGHMRPNDVQAGYQVADELLKHFERPETVRMAALNGDPSVQVAHDREAGLKQRLNEAPGAELVEVGTADWIEESALVTARNLMEKHAGINAFWAASDPMALGAIRAIKETDKTLGEDIVVASIDWTGRGLKAVRDGDMLANVGGHFMEAGIALLLLYDYHHGQDFAGELGTRFKTPMYPVNRENIETYFEKVGTDPDWSSIDFTQFTKTHNPDLDRYDFSWEAISGQLK